MVCKAQAIDTSILHCEDKSFSNFGVSAVNRLTDNGKYPDNESDNGTDADKLIPMVVAQAQLPLTLVCALTNSLNRHCTDKTIYGDNADTDKIILGADTDTLTRDADIDTDILTSGADN